MRTLRSFLLGLAGLFSPLAFSQADSAAFEDLLVRALQGDLTQVLREMSALHDAALTPKQAVLCHRFGDRFGAEEQDELPAFGDTAFTQIYDFYARYWRKVLRDNAGQEKYEADLRNAVTALIDPLYRPYGTATDTVDWTERLRGFLGTRGLYAATGRTGAFLDLLVHVRETEMHYPVTTPEDTLVVKVIFMDSVLSNGWEGFATFDTYYPGGWATTDALYCAQASYDTTSEEFHVSYLAHEGEHFADYKRFPKLQGPDLEYRAKLVELALADGSLPSLLTFFLRNSGTDDGNPHAFANHCVMRDLSRRLFGKDLVDDPKAWAQLPRERVNSAARELLVKNTRDLERAGAGQVERFIR